MFFLKNFFTFLKIWLKIFKRERNLFFRRNNLILLLTSIDKLNYYINIYYQRYY